MHYQSLPIYRTPHNMKTNMLATHHYHICSTDFLQTVWAKIEADIFSLNQMQRIVNS